MTPPMPFLPTVKRWIRRALRPVEPAPYLALSTRPLILHAKDWAFGRQPSPLLKLVEQVKGEPVYVLYNFSQYIDDDRMQRLEDAVDRLAIHHGDTRLTVLAPTREEQNRVQRWGYKAIHCNQNAFADEQVFRPIAGTQRRFDAVYDAKMVPFKRHELASQVDRLALITYLHGDSIDPEYRQIVETALGDVHWFNNPFDRKFSMLEFVEVNAALNQCRVGLCLSAREGTMAASIQYLLAGLPVVTTPSLGGRTEFFDPEYVATVHPNPVAVADAVCRMIKEAPSPEVIRSRVLEKMQAHRARLFDLMDSILSQHKEHRSFRDDWPYVRRHMLFDRSLSGRHSRSLVTAHNRQIIEAVRSRRPLPPENV